jgi:chemotaxis protein CheD
MADIDTVAHVYLQPGDFHFTQRPTVIRTILGSCVGVTFWTRRLAVGALCHGVLPRYPKHGSVLACGHYVDTVLRDLLRRFDELGIARSELEVKVFGGADVLPVDSRVARERTVGHQNWNTAMEVLAREQVRVVASDVGGTSGRSLQFDTATGEVRLRRLSELTEMEQTSLEGRR